VTVSFSKYLSWQAMHFLQRSTHFSKTCCRQFAASFRRIMDLEVWTSELPFYSWKSPEVAWGAIWTVWRMFLWGSTALGERIHCHFSIRNADAPLRLLLHPRRVSFKTTLTPFSISGWSVVRSASLAKGGTSKNRPSPRLHKVPTQSNKVSPRTLQTALVINHLSIISDEGWSILIKHELNQLILKLRRGFNNVTSAT
jgi:hypothetical protein